jgi:acyl-CoA thioesterase-1
MERMGMRAVWWKGLVSAVLLLTAAGGAGFNAARAQGAPQPVVMVLGDSLSAGYGLPAGRGWVDLLRSKMEQETPGYKVVNASISGETTVGGRNRLPKLLERHRPAVVIVELGANDGLRGTALEAVRDNLTAIATASRNAGAEVIIVGMRLPPNYGADYGRRFHALFGEVAKAQRAAWVPFLLEAFAARREMFQDDGIHPVANAQPLMLEAVWSPLKPLLLKANQPARALLAAPAA